MTMMRRVALALLVPALIAAGPPAAPPSGSVNSLRLEPRAGNTELTVEIAGGDVAWKDFRLSGPPRVVLDIEGARTSLAGRYEGINRGGVAAVRTSQYRPDVVRVVLILDRQAEYTVDRVPDGIRVSVSGGSAAFQPWSSGAAPQAAPVPTRVADRPERAYDPPVPPAARAPQRTAQQQPGRGRPITVTFENAPMRDVLASFAEFSGRSIIPGADVSGITVAYAEVRNQPWDEALRSLLQAYGLAAEEAPSGIIRVDAIAKLAERERQEPLVTQPFRINYVPVAEMETTLSKLLSERGSIASNSTTNTLIVTDVAGNVSSFERLIRDLDVRTPQVSINAKIVFINRTDTEALGITYDLKDSRGNQLNQLVAVPDPNNPGEFTNENLISLGGNSIAALGNANQRVAGASLQTVISLVLGRYTLVTFLDALQTAQLSDVQAAPVVTTVANRQAEIWVGERTPIRVVDLGGNQGNGGDGGAANNVPRASAQLVETGIRLRVTPQVTADRKVLMDIHAERSSAQLAATEIGVQFVQQQGDTRVMVNDGETAVIGGLTVTEVNTTRTGIPFLMDIPLLGGLFRRTSSEEVKRDLLIMVTPHIVDDRS
jgi:type IV pilus assembly protein PilQ